MMTKQCLLCGQTMLDSTYEAHFTTGPFCATCSWLNKLTLRPEEEPLPGYDHYRGRSDTHASPADAHPEPTSSGGATDGAAKPGNQPRH